MGDKDKKDKKVSSRKLKGFQDYSPEYMHLRNSITDQIKNVALRNGYQAISTPALEYSDVLLGVGGETDKQVFRFEDNGGRDVAMRFDLTVPFARYVAENHGTMIFPFKRLQIGEVWRAEKPQKGRYREFGQCDLDIIGVESLEADIELVQSMAKILCTVLPVSFTMSLGHREVLSGLVQTLIKIDHEDESGALICIDKLDKIGPNKVIELLKDIPGADPEGCATLIEVIGNKELSQEEYLTRVKAELKDNEHALNAANNLHLMTALLSRIFADDAVTFKIDLSIARGLGYYTGVVFESQIDCLENFGSVCSGGRYNKLAERFINKELPGVGGSVGLDRLIAGLAELGENQKKNLFVVPHCDVFIAIADPMAMEMSFVILNMLRNNGFSSEIALKTKKLNQQFKYADRKQIPLVLTIGGDEIQHNTVSIKIMKTGEELKSFPVDSLVSKIQSLLSESSE